MLQSSCWGTLAAVTMNLWWIGKSVRWQKKEVIKYKWLINLLIWKRELLLFFFSIGKRELLIFRQCRIYLITRVGYGELEIGKKFKTSLRIYYIIVKCMSRIVEKCMWRGTLLLILLCAIFLFPNKRIYEEFIYSFLCFIYCFCQSIIHWPPRN